MSPHGGLHLVDPAAARCADSGPEFVTNPQRPRTASKRLPCRQSWVSWVILDVSYPVVLGVSYPVILGAHPVDCALLDPDYNLVTLTGLEAPFCGHNKGPTELAL